MPMSTIDSRVTLPRPSTSGRPLAPSQLEMRLPTLLSVIAGTVDLTGFLNLGNLFTAHITGNLVVVAALIVRGGRINPAQVLAIPASSSLSRPLGSSLKYQADVGRAWQGCSS